MLQNSERVLDITSLDVTGFDDDELDETAAKELEAYVAILGDSLGNLDGGDDVLGDVLEAALNQSKEYAESVSLSASASSTVIGTFASVSANAVKPNGKNESVAAGANNTSVLVSPPVPVPVSAPASATNVVALTAVVTSNHSAENANALGDKNLAQPPKPARYIPPHKRPGFKPPTSAISAVIPKVSSAFTSTTAPAGFKTFQLQESGATRARSKQQPKPVLFSSKTKLLTRNGNLVSLCPTPEAAKAAALKVLDATVCKPKSNSNGGNNG